MKYNYQKNLNVKVPNDIRLSVYKEALSIIKKGELKFGLSQFYLCLLLPCILYELNYYMQDRKNGRMWHLHEVKKGFPEIEPFIKKLYECGYDIEKKNELRKKILEEIIEDFR